ncbi:MAG: GNAT family N-acetyltransferase [Cyclobacteriaceae bacterium]|jgi:ribosomal protein S18 acetylase RimI-like enzyme
MDIKIEKARTNDFKVIHALICEFSDFQNSRNRVSVTIEMMMEQKDFFNCYVARNSHREIIGYTSYSIIYYSWVGKSLYLDDLYVRPSFRGRGIGKKLMNTVFDIAKKEKCNRVRWQVSKWNSEAIKFYKKIGARIDDTELNCDLIISGS